MREIPSTVVSKQYHSQDEFGNYKYGYTNPNFEKHESGNANSEVKGHYSYIDENGNAISAILHSYLSLKKPNL